MEDSPEKTETERHSNINLIYNYTEYRIKLANDSLNALNTKLGSIIAFSGAAIGFLINLSSKAPLGTSTEQGVCYSCLILKILVCLFLGIAIYTSTSGFSPQAGGGMTPPRLLMQENYYDTEEECRLIITKTWLDALDEFESMREFKADYVTKAVVALRVAAVLAVLDIILLSLIPML